MNARKPKIGVGLRSTHFPHIESGGSIRADWFEAISENYMDTEGRPLQMLLLVRDQRPVGLHGVSLSVGSHQGIDAIYLDRLKRLVDRIEPIIVSDHLCWSKTPSHSTHDLLPLPFTEEALEIVVRNVAVTQERLKRQILLENVSSYIRFASDQFSEWDFLVQVARRSGCKILLDVNNIYVNSQNHGFDPNKYLDAIPSELIGQVHLAGFTDVGTFLFDTHSACVSPETWNLFARLAPRIPSVPILLEWDENIPALEAVENEALKAAEFFGEVK